jgi:hypothetical protein
MDVPNAASLRLGSFLDRLPFVFSSTTRTSEQGARVTRTNGPHSMLGFDEH